MCIAQYRVMCIAIDKNTQKTSCFETHDIFWVVSQHYCNRLTNLCLCTDAIAIIPFVTNVDKTVDHNCTMLRRYLSITVDRGDFIGIIREQHEVSHRNVRRKFQQTLFIKIELHLKEVSKNICEMKNCEQATQFCRKSEMSQQEQP